MSTDETLTAGLELLGQLKNERQETIEIIQDHCDNACTISTCRDHFLYPCKKDKCPMWRILKRLGEVGNAKESA